MKKALLLLLGVVFVSGCESQFRPYGVQPFPKVAQSIATEKGASAIGICHASDEDPSAVLAEAQYLCPKGSVTKASEEHFWTPCALTQPYRSTFICRK